MTEYKARPLYGADQGWTTCPPGDREHREQSLRAAEQRVIEAAIAESEHDERSPRAAGARVERREAVAALLALCAKEPR